MTKLTLSDLTSLANQTSAINTITDNYNLIEGAMENTLSRDGTSPNEMLASIDMNSSRIFNLPTPVTNSDAATKAYVDTLAGTFDPANDPTDIIFDDITVNGDLTLGSGNLDITSTNPATKINMFQEGSESTLFGSNVIRGADTGSHSNFFHSLLHIENRPVGSGLNGPNSADYGQSISIAKHNYQNGTSAPTGEIDGLTIGVRQAGTTSDAGCILGNIAHTGTGFIAFFEASVSLIPAPSFSTTRSMQLHCGSMNTATDLCLGYDAIATTGALDACFYADTQSGATWDFILQGKKNGTDVHTIDGNGNTMHLRNDSVTTTPSIVLSQAGTGDPVMQWLIPATTAWTAGIDNSDSDAWKLQSAGDGFATAVNVRISTAGLFNHLGNITPFTNDAASLGTATVSYSDLFLASGAVINFNNGNTTLTHTTGNLTMGSGNTFNTIKSDANTTTPAINVEQSSTGDVFIQWLLSSVRAWCMGIDNSDNDSLKIGPANDSFATAALAITTGGSVQALNATGGLGYGTGAGGTVTQATSRTTGVTLNKVTGAITMVNAAGSATPASFTVTNSAVGTADTIILNVKSGATNTYNLSVSAVNSGSFVITFFTSGGTASDTPVINFNVIKGATA